MQHSELRKWGIGLQESIQVLLTFVASAGYAEGTSRYVVHVVYVCICMCVGGLRYLLLSMVAKSKLSINKKNRETYNIRCFWIWCIILEM